MDELYNQYINLHRSIDYALNHLDNRNFTATTRKQWTDELGRIGSLEVDAAGLRAQFQDAQGRIGSLELSAERLSSDFSAFQTDTEGNIRNLTSSITQTAGQIQTEVQDRKNAVSSLSSRITQNASAISSEVSARQSDYSSLSTRITQTANSIDIAVSNATSASSLRSKLNTTYFEFSTYGFRIKRGGTTVFDASSSGNLTLRSVTMENGSITGGETSIRIHSGWGFLELTTGGQFTVSTAYDVKLQANRYMAMTCDTTQSGNVSGGIGLIAGSHIRIQSENGHIWIGAPDYIEFSAPTVKVNGKIIS